MDVDVGMEVGMDVGMDVGMEVEVDVKVPNVRLITPTIRVIATLIWNASSSAKTPFLFIKSSAFIITRID
jgi:hypothetical protein